MHKFSGEGDIVRADLYVPEKSNTPDVKPIKLKNGPGLPQLPKKKTKEETTSGKYPTISQGLFTPPGFSRKACCNLQLLGHKKIYHIFLFYCLNQYVIGFYI